MKLNIKEKYFIDKIHSISGIDRAILKEVFYSILIGVVLELYSGNNEIVIPYLFSAKIKYKKTQVGKRTFQIDEIYDVKTNPILHEIIVSILSNRTVPIEKFLKKEITAYVDSLLDYTGEQHDEQHG